MQNTIRITLFFLCDKKHLTFCKPVYLAMSKIYETPHCATSSILPSHHSSLIKMCFLRTLFLNTLSLCSSFSVRDQVSQPYKTTGRIVVLYSFSLLSRNERRLVKSPVCLSVCPPLITFEPLRRI
jgi:hypothetical protein